MPTFLLCVRAEVENVGNLALAPNADFCFDVQESGGAEVRKGVHISPVEEVELSGSKGTANFVMKFDKGSKREASVNVLQIKGVTRSFTQEDAEARAFVPIAAFECRGLEPIAYMPQGGWTVTAANSSTKWEDVDLSDEWVEYDEKAAESVSILKVESLIKLHTG